MAIPESEIIETPDGWIACPPVGASFLCRSQAEAMDAHDALMKAYQNGKRDCLLKEMIRADEADGLL